MHKYEQEKCCRIKENDDDRQTDRNVIFCCIPFSSINVLNWFLAYEKKILNNYQSYKKVDEEIESEVWQGRAKKKKKKDEEIGEHIGSVYNKK